MSDTFDQYLELADQAAQLEKWQQVMEVLSVAHMLKPEHSGALAGLATSMMHLGRPEQALTYFRKLTRLQPASAEAFNNLGLAYWLAGEPVNAEQAYLQAVELDHENTQAWKNLALLYLQDDARLQDGVEILANLVRYDPGDADALFMLGQCYEIGDDLASAVMMFELALQADPGHALARRALAALQPEGVMESGAMTLPEHVEKLVALNNRQKPRGAGPA